MSDERFKNATKEHLIGEIKKLEQEVERLRHIESYASERETRSYYQGQTIVYEKILDLVKTYHAIKVTDSKDTVLEDLPF